MILPLSLKSQVHQEWIFRQTHLSNQRSSTSCSLTRLSCSCPSIRNGSSRSLLFLRRIHNDHIQLYCTFCSQRRYVSWKTKFHFLDSLDRLLLSFTAPMPPPPADKYYILQHVSGMSLDLLERARTELDIGIRKVERSFDLVRAAVGIARHLCALGRFIEGWSIPVARLVVSCGLHRMSGNFIPPDGSPGPIDAIPKPYAPCYQYLHSHSAVAGASGDGLPVLRMRPVIIPPPRDEIELAERVMTFWSAKMQDWESGTGWGWSLKMADDECTTEWGWGWGGVEVSKA